MRQGLHIYQGLRLTQTLTPQMRMNLELIQAPILEAVEELEQKVMVNPWLERNEEATDPRFVRDADRSSTGTQPTPRQEADFQEAEAWFDSDAETWLDPVAATPWTHEEFPADETSGAVAIHNPSPYEQLEVQIRELDLSREVQTLAIQLLPNLDEHGYMSFPEEELLAAFGMPPEKRPVLDQALHVLRYQLDPPGLGCRDQSHSFLVQLERHEKGDSLAARLIREGALIHIKPRNLESVARKLGVTVTDLHAALEDLHRLCRNPLSLLDQTVEPTRYPDLVVERVDGDWQVSLSHPLSGRYRYRETRIPRKSALDREASDKGDSEDPAEILRRLRQMRQDARMLVRATEYRDRTLYEIGNQLVREQRDFLEKGEEALKPLLQKELAERLGLNEATVSRILKEKFMQTPRGVIPLSAFFSRSITNRKGEKVANKAVMDALSRLIGEEEDPSHPWSDQEISVLLRQRGFPISRRTVTKYRMILSIGAAGDRKAQRKIQESTEAS